MFLWILGFLLLMGFITLFYRALATGFARKVGRTVDRHHHATEHVLANRRPPEEWIDRLSRRFPGAREGTLDTATSKRARKVLLGWVRNLERYFTRSPMVADEETRAHILESLQDVREEWEERELSDLLAPQDADANTDVAEHKDEGEEE